MGGGFKMLKVDWWGGDALDEISWTLGASMTGGSNHIH